MARVPEPSSPPAPPLAPAGLAPRDAMTAPSPSSDHDSQTDLARRAGGLTLGVGVAGILIFVLAAVVLLAVGMMSGPPQGAAQDSAQARSTPRWLDVRSSGVQATGVMLVLSLLPGVGLVALAGGVRSRRRGAVLGAMLLVLAQALVLGAMLGMDAVQALRHARPGELVASAVVLGGPLLLLAAACYWLWRLWSRLSAREKVAG